MNALRCICAAILLAVAPVALAADPAAVEIKQAVPVETHLVVLAQHNPEADYQRAYLEDIWKTVQDEKLVERITELVMTQVSDEDMQQAKSAMQEIRDAAAPIDWKALSGFDEIVYAQAMEPPFTHHLMLLSSTTDAAIGGETGVKNLLTLIEQKSEGKVKVKTLSENSIEITMLDLPPEVPFRPSVARVDGVLIVSSSENLVRQSVGMLRGSGEPSKFDDPRLVEALKKMPEPEDVLVFFDGRQLFAQMRKIGEFVKTKAPDKPESARVADVLNRVIDEVAILDYEVTVQYTEGFRSCAQTLGALEADADQKILGKMVLGGKPFENWQRWVPVDAVSYSLTTGVNLHPAYEGVMSILREQIPESQPELDKFEQAQKDIGVHLDQDLLQSFSGESVSVTLPAESAGAMGGPDSVLALKCDKPERIRELLHRLVEGLQQFPAVQAQQIKLKECDELEGFDEFSAMSLAMVGKRPVIGFHEGWMIIASSPAAVQKVLDTYHGKGKTIADAPSFERFDLDVEGPVSSVSYSHLAESTRQTADTIRQIGMMGPMLIGMAGADAEPEDLKPVQEALALLPSIANVVAKFDFLEAMLSVTQQGDAPNTYQRRTVTLVRPPAKLEVDTESKAEADGDAEPAGATAEAP